MDIHELYQKAGELHGHYCPGLAIGVRAAAEALRILDIREKGHGLYCIAENRACYIDGVQMIFGTSWGKGNLEIRPRGKTAFNFYDRGTGKSVRLAAKDRPKDMSRAEMAEYILSAPLEAVFDQTNVHFEAPEDKDSGRGAPRVCPRCGEKCREDFLRMVDGEIVCLDCAEKAGFGRD